MKLKCIFLIHAYFFMENTEAEDKKNTSKTRLQALINPIYFSILPYFNVNISSWFLRT